MNITSCKNTPIRISDSHTDFLTVITSSKSREDYVKELSHLGLFNISCAIFTTDKKFNIQDIKKYADELNHYREKFQLNLILSIEDLSFIRDTEELHSLIKLRPISTTLTWNHINQFGGGANTTQGLTSLGRECIGILEDNRVLIDTAHMSRRTFWQFTRLTKYPIYNSHSNINSLKSHNRNLTDRQILKIVQSDGYLGLTWYDNFVNADNITARDISLQFDYLIKRFGYKNFGIGSDLYGIDDGHLPANLKSYSEINNLILELRNLGYNEEVIDCLIYKNYEDFLSRFYNLIE